MRVALIAMIVVLGTAGRLAAQGYVAIDFNKLSNYEYELPDPFDPAPRSLPNVIPDAVKSLNGKLVAIEGFMLPLDLTPQGVSVFMLNASLDMCYFGAPVRINEWVLVTMKGGKRAAFTHLATTVKGKLSVGEEIRNGRVTSLYRLEAAAAEVEGRR
ncbi:MAG: DUF3299 domain-containing protein [Acidobacteria bacterium]|nr:DUF3299 domain-containing protein [Acidobacteriota bacterium]